MDQKNILIIIIKIFNSFQVRKLALKIGKNLIDHRLS